MKKAQTKKPDFLDWKDKPIDTPNAKQLEVWNSYDAWGRKK